jgi:hypothetical protein
MSMDDADFEALHRLPPEDEQDAEQLAELMVRVAADLARVAQSYLRRDPLDVSKDERVRLSEALHRMTSAQMLFNDLRRDDADPPKDAPGSDV